MKSLTNFINGLLSEVGVIYSIVLIAIGFASGILTWRWYKDPALGAGQHPEFEETTNLVHELDELVQATSELWGKNQSPSSQRPQKDGKQTVYAAPERSRWQRVSRRIFGRGSKDHQEAVGEDPSKTKNNLKETAKILQSQTAKIRYITARLPSVVKPAARHESIEDAHTFNYSEHKTLDDSHVDPIGSPDKADESQLERRTNAQKSAPPSRPQISGAKSAGHYREITSVPLVSLYNNAVSDSFAREQFREQYQPIRIGTVNAVERRQNPTAAIKPELRETSDGDFFAFPLSGANKYAVVPRLGLTIGAVSYNAGALGELFSNPSYDPVQSYSRYYLLEPALFKREGERWELLRAGHLDLGSPD